MIELAPQWFKKKLRDDRGARRVVTYSVPSFRLSPRMGAALHLQHRSVEQIARGPWLYILSIAGFILCVGLSIKELRDQDYSDAIGGFIAALISILYIPAARYFAGKLRIRANAADPYCPTCGYDLTGTPVADDGCRICSECSAAWRFARDAKSGDPSGDAKISQPQHAEAAHPQTPPA
jgi:hypothetical protein